MTNSCWPQRESHSSLQRRWVQRKSPKTWHPKVKEKRHTKEGLTCNREAIDVQICITVLIIITSNFVVGNPIINCTNNSFERTHNTTCRIISTFTDTCTWPRVTSTVHVHVWYWSRIQSNNSPIDEESNEHSPSEGREEHWCWNSAHGSVGQRSNSERCFYTHTLIHCSLAGLLDDGYGDANLLYQSNEEDE